jgi:hypothetical protein
LFGVFARLIKGNLGEKDNILEGNNMGHWEEKISYPHVSNEKRSLQKNGGYSR